MIVITLLFGVFYLVDLQRPMSRYEPYDPRFAGKFKLHSGLKLKKCK